MDPLLELSGVRKSFGGLEVIGNLDLMVREREIVSLIGPNGAGKTTVFNLITGVYGPDEGSIRLDGRELVGVPPHRVTTMGVARTCSASPDSWWGARTSGRAASAIAEASWVPGCFRRKRPCAGGPTRWPPRSRARSGSWASPGWTSSPARECPGRSR